MLKLIVQHSPTLVTFLCGLHLRLSKPQWQHVLRLADGLIVSDIRHKTMAGLYRLMVDAPDASNGADTLRLSPWTAEDLRAPLRHFIVADLLTYARQSDQWTLYVSLDDSLGAKDKGTRHLEAVEYHHGHTKSQGRKKPYYTNGTVHVEVRLALGTRSYAYDWRLYLREKTVRRLNRERPPEQRLRFRKKTTLAQEMLAELHQLLPAGLQVYVLFDSWYAANRLLRFCRRQGWHVVCAIKSNRKLDDQKLSQWPQALRHQRYQQVQLTATDGRQRPYLVRPLQGRRTHLSFDVCVLISKRHHRDKHPKYFLCTDLTLSAQQILSIYQKRWPVGVSRKGHRNQSVEVRPRRKDSSLVAWEASWRANKTVEPSDNMRRKAHAQHTRLQRAVNADVASLHATPVAETVDNVRRQQGLAEKSLRRQLSPAGSQR